MNTIVIMSSGNGSNFEEIARKIINENYICDVKLVLICNKKDAFVIKRAQKYNIETVIVDDQQHKPRSLFDKKVLEVVNDINPTLIVLAGYMKILSPEFTRLWGFKTLNLHPSLLPSFKGAHAIRDAFNYGVKITGITIHFVNEELDSGKIIFQKECNINDDDTLESLETKIHKLEYTYFIQVIKEKFMETINKQKYALVSVSDKEGVVEFCQNLNQNGYQIISTGGTYSLLEKNKVDVISIEKYSNFDEIMDGRVKTLQPIIHGGLLALRDNEEHMNVISENNWNLIDLVCVNLYPFEEVIANKDCTFENAIENIDIGGPSMLRSAAKNFKDVYVVCDKNDYSNVISKINDDDFEFRKSLAKKAFLRCSLYNAAIYNYLEDTKFPENIITTFTKKQELRYGENSHQEACMYTNNDVEFGSIANTTQLNGKELSYNNIIDANAAIEIIKEFKNDLPTTVALKHTNPCGVATRETVLEAFLAAKNSDEVSIFGGIVAFNCEVDEPTALELKKLFLEIVIAPSFSIEALQILKEKKNLRVLTISNLETNESELKLTSIQGGLLVSDYDHFEEVKSNFKQVSGDEELPEKFAKELVFAQKICKYVKSNAIVLTSNSQVIGVGAGQMNRINSLEIALAHAKKFHADKLDNICLASDAFFPFDDSVKLAAKNNIKYIVQPGGSLRDQDSIDACNENNITMVLTNIRHFKH